MDFVWIAVICGILGFATVIYFVRYVLREPSGTERINEITGEEVVPGQAALRPMTK